MRALSTMFSVLLSLGSVTWATGHDVIPALDTTDPIALQEATRVLAEEIKLAARPQTYLLIDLEAQTIQIKSRGIELHHLPIESWSTSHIAQLATAYRLRDRPPVTRRKIDPVAGAEQVPISLADMPTTFTLQFSPPLTILVLSHTHGNPWQRAIQRGRTWWHKFTSWSSTLRTGDRPLSPSLRLTVSFDHAQSLAWTVTDGMPVLIRRTTTP